MTIELYVKRVRRAKTLLLRNPRLFLETSSLALRALRPLPDHPVKKTMNGIQFEFDFALDPKVKNMYYGYYEYPTVKAMRTLLRRGGVFVDVGANIGYISAIAMGLVGEEGRVYSFEPVPAYFERLASLAKAHPTYSVTPERIALGDASGTALIDVSSVNIGNNTLVQGWMPPETVKERVEAPVRRLDEYMEEVKMPLPSLIKIDTEGYDFSVLRGMERFFETTSERPPIITEITPGSFVALETPISDLWQYMSGWGYRPTSLIDGCEVSVEKVKGNMEVLFVASHR